MDSETNNKTADKATNESESHWLKETLPLILKNGKLVDNFVTEKLETFKLKELSVNFISKEEAFMLTVCYRAKVNFEYDNKNYTKYLVVKKTPKIDAQDYEVVNFDNLFGNEIIAYTVIFPALEKFSGEKYQGPQLLYSEKGHLYATLVMDDFGINGWKITEKRYDLDLDHAIQAAKTLGKFHANTFAFKHAHPEEFPVLLKDLKEPRYVIPEMPHMWEVATSACFERTLESAQKYSKKVDEEFILFLINMIKSYYKTGLYFVKPHEPLATICHGDYLRNNVAYKYQDNKPIDLMMFDLQTIRYASPMIDLTLFISLSTMSGVRKPNFNVIFDSYVNALHAQYTQLLNKQVPDFLQRDSLLKEYIRVWPLAFSACVFFLMMVMDPESAPNLENTDMPDDEIIAMVKKAAGEPCNQEIAEQINEFYELCQMQKINIKELYADFF